MSDKEPVVEIGVGGFQYLQLLFIIPILSGPGATELISSSQTETKKLYHEKLQLSPRQFNPFPPSCSSKTCHGKNSQRDFTLLLIMNGVYVGLTVSKTDWATPSPRAGSRNC